jgi:hypothetical protein
MRTHQLRVAPYNQRSLKKKVQTLVFDQRVFQTLTNIPSKEAEPGNAQQDLGAAEMQASADHIH